MEDFLGASQRDRLIALEMGMKHVATKADLERLRGHLLLQLLAQVKV